MKNLTRTLALMLIVMVMTSCSTVKTEKNQKDSTIPDKSQKETTVLKLNLADGFRFRYQLFSKLEMFYGFYDTTLSVPMTDIGELEFKVIKIKSDSTIELEYFTKNSSSSINVNGKEIILDTLNNQSKPLNGYGSSIRNLPFRVTINPYGKVSNITFTNPILNAIMEGGDIIENDNTISLDQSTESTISDSNMIYDIEQIFLANAPDPVTIGASWQKAINMGIGETLFFTNHKFDVVDIKSGKVYLTDTAEIKSDTTVIDKGLWLEQYKMTGTQTGKIVMAQSTGLPDSTEYNYQISGTFKRTINSTNQVQDIPLTMKMSFFGKIIPIK